jgi:hypothetical protein
MDIGDIVTVKTSLGQIVGKTTDGRWVVEWAFNEIDPYPEQDLYLIESKKVKNDPEM